MLFGTIGRNIKIIEGDGIDVYINTLKFYNLYFYSDFYPEVVCYLKFHYEKNQSKYVIHKNVLISIYTLV